MHSTDGYGGLMEIKLFEGQNFAERPVQAHRRRRGTSDAPLQAWCEDQSRSPGHCSTTLSLPKCTQAGQEKGDFGCVADRELRKKQSVSSHGHFCIVAIHCKEGFGH